MNRFAGLQRREAEGRPIRVGLIGAGVFGTMYAAQARRTPGVELAAVADLDPELAAARLREAGYDALPRISEALDLEGLEVVVEATGNPVAGARHARAAFAAGCHVVMGTSRPTSWPAGAGAPRRARRASSTRSRTATSPR